VRDLIVIGASAGGVQAITRLVSGLPDDLPAAVFVAIHMPAHSRSMLPSILNRVGSLPAAHASDGEPIRTGRIYVSSPDRHLLIDDGRIRLTRGPREHGHRPAIDALFRSAAQSHGMGVIGVVLSGALNDGASGLLAIKNAGGVAVAQSDARYPDMPASAADMVRLDHFVTIDEMGELLVSLAGTRGPSVNAGRALRAAGDLPDASANAPFQALETDGVPSEFGCPDCGGVLWQIDKESGEATGQRFRCRVGHAFTAESLSSQQGEQIEAALWSSLRALEERCRLLERLSARMRAHGHGASAERFAAEANAVTRQLEILREVLLNEEIAGEPSLPATDVV
jgi:two-component system, chemotaxis family, protein-glutamate methylesterase/glutaminase